MILCARFLTEARWKILYDFVIIYGVFAFVYYLRSPGWLRYILIAEFLVLFLLPHSVSVLTKYLEGRYPKISTKKFLPTALLLFLIVVQGVQFFTRSDIFYSAGAEQAAKSINANFLGKSVGVLNAIEVGEWLTTPERYLALDLTGLPQIGQNP